MANGGLLTQSVATPALLKVFLPSRYITDQIHNHVYYSRLFNQEFIKFPLFWQVELAGRVGFLEPSDFVFLPNWTQLGIWLFWIGPGFL